MIQIPGNNRKINGMYWIVKEQTHFIKDELIYNNVSFQISEKSIIHSIYYQRLSEDVKIEGYVTTYTNIYSRKIKDMHKKHSSKIKKNNKYSK